MLPNLSRARTTSSKSSPALPASGMFERSSETAFAGATKTRAVAITSTDLSDGSESRSLCSPATSTNTALLVSPFLRTSACVVTRCWGAPPASESCSSTCGKASTSRVTWMSSECTTTLSKASRASTCTVITSPATMCNGPGEPLPPSPPSTRSDCALPVGPVAPSRRRVAVIARMWIVALTRSFRSRGSFSSNFSKLDVCLAVLCRTESPPRASVIGPACVEITGRTPRPPSTMKVGAAPPATLAPSESSRAKLPE
mmetsp:Transcript_44450/g.147345  ORF Transcript_44450/g.147345 Transcript_44450/m.147345 type:complete len:257 (-) Transcript_44450:670-1440(-)